MYVGIGSHCIAIFMMYKKKSAKIKKKQYFKGCIYTDTKSVQISLTKFIRSQFHLKSFCTFYDYYFFEPH